MENKPCPCATCSARKYYAKAFDFHVWGEDCPYQCPKYDQWKFNQLRAEKDGVNDAETGKR